MKQFLTNKENGMEKPSSCTYTPYPYHSSLPPILIHLALKVGSCPNDDNSVRIFYLSFSVLYLNNYNF